MDALITITFLNVALAAALLLMQPLVRDIAVGLRYTIWNFDDRVDEGVFLAAWRWSGPTRSRRSCSG